MYTGKLTDKLCEIQNKYYDKFQENIGLADVKGYLTEDEIIARIQKAINENSPILWEDKEFYIDYELIDNIKEESKKTTQKTA